MRTRVLVPNRDAVTRSEGEEAIIYSPLTAEIMVLNPSGFFIWQLICSQPSNTQDIVKSLCDSFDVGEKSAEEDTTAFLSSLEKHGFILP